MWLAFLAETDSTDSTDSTARLVGDRASGRWLPSDASSCDSMIVAGPHWIGGLHWILDCQLEINGLLSMMTSSKKARLAAVDQDVAVTRLPSC